MEDIKKNEELEMDEWKLLKALGLSNAHFVYESDIVHVDKVVTAGYPIDLGDDTPEYKEALNRVLSKGARVIVDIRGRSMECRGIVTGDSVQVSVQCTAESNDIVIASLDGEETLKIYFEDEDGEAWLVPDSADPQFVPIRIRDYTNVRIVGKVVRVIKGETPRGNTSEVLKAIRAVKKTMADPIPSQQQIARALSLVKDMIKANRQWFAVYSVLYHRGSVKTYDEFHSLLTDIMGVEAPKLDLDDLKKMETMSFRKSYTEWSEKNAPVTGSRFRHYRKIAETFSQAL